MSSIHTNVTAMAALQTLRSVDASLDGTQRTVSSGLRVQSASDNAAYWSIATTMRSDNSVLSTVSDSMGVAKGILDVTYNGMDNVRSELTKIRNLVIGAKDLPTPTVTLSRPPFFNDYVPDPAFDSSEMAKVDQEITQHFEQISSIISSSSFSGVNLLVNAPNKSAAASSSIEFVTGYSRAGGVETTSLPLSATAMVDYSAAANLGSAYFNDNSGGFLDGAYVVSRGSISYGTAYPVTYGSGNGSIQASRSQDILRQLVYENTFQNLDPQVGFGFLISELDKRIENIVSGMSKVGAVQTRLDQQDDFIGKLTDTLAKGVGRLVDADMNQASTRIRALQTQQQLAIQSLSIANSQPQNIMQLFK
ncbi:MAG TPA: flagellin [Ensifer sp.]|nr:flagellin [Ensifer sp.]